MHRRQVLRTTSAVFASAVTAGCLGSGSDAFRTEGNDDEPFDVDPGELLLPMESLQEVLAPGWSEMERAARGASMFHDADASRNYVPYDEEDGFHEEDGYVSTGAWLFADVETARDYYATHPYQDGWGFEERAIAVESMAGSGETSSQFRVVFRDANAVGGLQYDNDRINDEHREQRGLELAVLMHEGWRGD